jgi:hypothetical protein
VSAVDLQIHTTFSDGLNTPTEIVRLAVTNGVSVVAITDHDNVAGIPEARAAAAGTKVTVIPGIEISTSTAGMRLHILGYGIDIGNSDLKKLLDPIFAYRRENLIAKMKLLSDDLVREGKQPIDIDEFIESQHGYFGRPGASRFLVQKGIVADPQAGFDLLSGIHTSESGPTVTYADAVRVIHAAGGLAVVSHPFGAFVSIRKISSEVVAQDRMLRELRDAGLDGIECFQSEHGPEETTRALGVANELGLFVTGGSDWHGPLEAIGAGREDFMSNYPAHFGGLDVPFDAVRPILDRLGIKV